MVEASQTRMSPIASASTDVWSNVRVILTDIDDTLTTHGRVTADAYTALENLRAAGVLIIPVTGRPAGWCDLIARAWPVDAVVGENGAFYFRYDERRRRMIRVSADSEVERREKRKRLDALATKILHNVPGSAISADQAYRQADLAIDFCEDVPPLSDAAIAAITDAFKSEGATAKISSIHVNGWFGAYDKLTMTRRLLAEAFSIDIDRHNDLIVFVGDSPNDSPMFGHFVKSVGVSNVRTLADRCEWLPAYVTHSPQGHGFAELAATILKSRAI